LGNAPVIYNLINKFIHFNHSAVAVFIKGCHCQLITNIQCSSIPVAEWSWAASWFVRRFVWNCGVRTLQYTYSSDLSLISAKSLNMKLRLWCLSALNRITIKYLKTSQSWDAESPLWALSINKVKIKFRSILNAAAASFCQRLNAPSTSRASGFGWNQSILSGFTRWSMR
jgi:hypothetical protein